MPTDDIDDLFRNKLDDHATPPGADLWARLNMEAGPAPAPEPVDELFRKGLARHATPSHRALWERLEDEHLRPTTKRRPAAWWPMALAAALALLLVAGGAGLWLGRPFGGGPIATVAVRQPGRLAPAAGTVQPKSAVGPQAAAGAASVVAAAAVPGPQTAPPSMAASNAEKNITRRATPAAALASSTPKAKASAARQSLRHLTGPTRPLDAATETARLVARNTPRPAPARPAAADEQRPAVAIAALPAPAPEIVPAKPTPSLTGVGEVITVDVRTSPPPAARPAQALASAMAEAAEEPRRLGGRLLQQAGHLVRGERVSLAEATGLPENVTLRAHIGGRSITKSIQL